MLLLLMLMLCCWQRRQGGIYYLSIATMPCLPDCLPAHSPCAMLETMS